MRVPPGLHGFESPSVYLLDTASVAQGATGPSFLTAYVPHVSGPFSARSPLSVCASSVSRVVGGEVLSLTISDPLPSQTWGTLASVPGPGPSLSLESKLR